MKEQSTCSRTLDERPGQANANSVPYIRDSFSSLRAKCIFFHLKYDTFDDPNSILFFLFSRFICWTYKKRQCLPYLLLVRQPPFLYCSVHTAYRVSKYNRIVCWVQYFHKVLPGFLKSERVVPTKASVRFKHIRCKVMYLTGSYSLNSSAASGNNSQSHQRRLRSDILV